LKKYRIKSFIICIRPFASPRQRGWRLVKLHGIITGLTARVNDGRRQDEMAG
jgi:hypothetical protein